MVFLDGQACAPRSAGNLNENVEHLYSIEGHELDAMEARLCSDCKEVAAGGGGSLGTCSRLLPFRA